jgi:tetratricopeptide (TPR) repeat protein
MRVLLAKDPNHFRAELMTVSNRLATVVLVYLVNEKQFENALILVESIEKQGSDALRNAEWNYLAAFCLHNLQVNLQEALRRYGLALEQGYDEFSVRYHRGLLHVKMGNVEQARIDLMRAVELKPDNEGVREILKQLESRL